MIWGDNVGGVIAYPNNDFDPFPNCLGTQLMPDFYEPDLGTTPDDPFARDADSKLVRRSYWLDMSDRSLVLTMTSGICGRAKPEHLLCPRKWPFRGRERT